MHSDCAIVVCLDRESFKTSFQKNEKTRVVPLRSFLAHGSSLLPSLELPLLPAKSIPRRPSSGSMLTPSLGGLLDCWFREAGEPL